jgi:hypothetical protein
MNYFDLSDDERQVWRSDTVTQAFKALLEDKLADATEDTLMALLNGREKDAFVLAGKNNGLGEALDILRRDR